MMNTIFCPFSGVFEYKCPYLETDGLCHEIDINVRNGDAWCSQMIDLALGFLDSAEGKQYL